MAESIVRLSPGKSQDLTGIVCGKLTVKDFAFKKSCHYYWRCECQCGGSTLIDGYKLRKGTADHCGCLTATRIGNRTRRHGQCGVKGPTSEHSTWAAMLQRCRDKNCKSYPRYGGRGITVCERWSTFVNFFADMGPKPTQQHSIDRIDNSKGYEPENCRWATRREQRLNKSDSVYVEFEGQRVSLFELCEKRGLAYYVAYQRLKKLGWTVAESILTPVRPLIKRCASD